jgi:hypothetical protein
MEDALRKMTGLRVLYLACPLSAEALDKVAALAASATSLLGLHVVAQVKPKDKERLKDMFQEAVTKTNLCEVVVWQRGKGSVKKGMEKAFTVKPATECEGAATYKSLQRRGDLKKIMARLQKMAGEYALVA